MEINTVNQNGVTVVQISGSLDANTVAAAQDTVMPLIEPGCLLVLDMGQCDYISSAGLRLLLMVAKGFKTVDSGQWSLASVSEEIMDVMEMTGFIQFFKTLDTVEEAIDAVQKVG